MDRRLDRQANALRAGAAAAMRCALAMLAAAACSDPATGYLLCPPGVKPTVKLAAGNCYAACIADSTFRDQLRAWPAGPSGAHNIAPDCGSDSACLCRRFIDAGGFCQLCADDSLYLDAQDSSISAVEVISAFAAVVDPVAGTTTRVCGTPLLDDAGNLLPGEKASAPNGIELTAALVAKRTGSAAGRCNPERNLGVADGEFVNGMPLRVQGPLATLRTGQVKMTFSCVQPHQTSPVDAPCGATSTTVAADVLRYRQEANPCDEGHPDSYQNVAILIDHSGSVQGFVSLNHKKCELATLAAEDLPNVVKQSDFNNCASDPYYQLVGGAAQFIDLLNGSDRVVALGFDETNQVFAGCTSKAVCQDDTGALPWACKSGCTCLHDSDCAHDGKEFHCGGWPDLSEDTVKDLPLSEGLKWCYGSSDTKKLQNKYGIDVKARYNANGRAAAYEALGAAYDFLRAAPPGPPDPKTGGNAKHIVLLTDGPDTCVPSDNFLFTTFAGLSGPGGQCRSECKFTSLHGYRELLLKMAHDQFPIRVHVIQIQSKGHLAPDPGYQELACRSQGTYQFINTEDFPRPDPKSIGPRNPAVSHAWQDAMAGAVSKVRNALAGQWRIGFKHAAFGAGNAPKGVQLALRGRITIADPQLPSLSSATEGAGARFDQPDGPRDTRLPYRLACASHADCGSTGDECAAHACTDTGLCRPTPAPDLRPCGPAGKGVCCQGQCAASCDGVCK